MVDPHRILRSRLRRSTLRDVGAELGVSAAFICNVLNGRRKFTPRLLAGLGLEKRTAITYHRAPR
jgi:hypothetical protein